MFVLKTTVVCVFLLTPMSVYLLLIGRIAHNLADGEIPVEYVRYELTDLFVTSLRASPEHRSLSCNWSAMLRLLENTTSGNMSDDDDSVQDRHLEGVKQRVLLQFLVSCAEKEVSSLTENENMDADVMEARRSSRNSVPAAKKKQKTSSAHEELTLKLLGALPSLVTSYKTETAVLRSLTSLPQYFCRLDCASL